MSEIENHRILIVDDEPDILEFLTYTLQREGIEVKTASDGIKGVKMASRFNPHLILLDVMMPGMDGIEACEKMRALPGGSDMIICFLTARSEDYSQIAGFDAGGDDYIIKPVKPRVLVSRIRALLRRYPSSRANALKLESHGKSGDFILDREQFILIKDGEEVFLPRKEFELMSLFLSHPGRVFTRDEIFRSVWGDDIVVGERTIDVHVRKLREKVGNEIIHTIKGVGYKFID